jgi:hypothetical protein
LLLAAQTRWQSWEATSDCETIIGDAQSALCDSLGRSYSAIWLNHPNGLERPAGLLLLACSTDRLGQVSQALLRALSHHLA